MFSTGFDVLTTNTSPLDPVFSVDNAGCEGATSQLAKRSSRGVLLSGQLESTLGRSFWEEFGNWLVRDPQWPLVYLKFFSLGGLLPPGTTIPVLDAPKPLIWLSSQR